MTLSVIASTLAPVALLFAMVQAAVSDLTTMKIRNTLIGALLLGYILFAPFSSLSFANVVMDLGAAIGVLVIGLLCFARGWIGGGDAKLAAATVLWLGVEHLPAYLLYGSLLGGALTLLILALRNWPLPPWLAAQPWIAALHRPNVGVPYGVALAAAALIILPETHWMAPL